MTSRKLKFLLVTAMIAAVWSASCAAQGTVYESKDKAGPVFSDQPSAGAKPIDVQPMNLMQGVAPQQQSALPLAAEPPYSSLAISSLANEDTIHTNTGAFEFRGRSTPAPRVAAGDRVRAKLDGNLLASSYSSLRIRVSADDWGATASSASVQHTLQLVIVDRTGAVLIESAPITFYAHRATHR